MSEPRSIRVALAGNPNAGKTTLFNALTGGSARTGNYPGVTVDRTVGRWSLPAAGDAEALSAELLDVPGTYSLSARSPEEQVAVDSILPREGPLPDVLVAVVDATALERHLYLALCLLETGRPTVLAVNLIDEARAADIEVDADALAAAMGARVVLTSARNGEGLEALAAAVADALGDEPRDETPEQVPPTLEAAVREVESALRPHHGSASAAALRSRALWTLLSLDDDDELEGVPEEVRRATRAARESVGVGLDEALIAARYERLGGWVEAAVTDSGTGEAPALTRRLDAWLTHPVAGVATFAAVMYVLFEALFAWSDPLIGLIESAVQFIQAMVVGALDPGPLRDLLVEGVIAGVGNVVVFVPQIALLFTFIALLEDSGYLARVAFLIDRVMRGLGLHGKAFVPLLSGFACAVPAIMATRTIESRRDRLVTMMALPLMSCSARLPVYALVTAVVFAGEDRVLGFLSVGALVLFAMYALSVVVTLGAAAAFRRTILRGPAPTLVLELPPYRVPVARNVAREVGARLRSFLVDAGTIILAITIVLWGLLSFPNDDAIAARYAALATAPGADVAAIEAQEAEAQMRQSYAGRLGRFIEPALEPLGFDWRIGVGLIGSFAAREVLVSTLGIVWGVGDAVDEETVPLREALAEARRADGSPLFTPLSGLALMVFFVLAAQCMSTLAVVKRESGSWKWPALMVVYMTALAYVGALVTYQGGLLLGFT